MPQPLALRHHAAVTRKRIAWIRNRRAAEIQRIAIAGTHHFYRVGVKQGVDVGNLGRQSRDPSATVGHRACHVGNTIGRCEWLIALQIHHDGIIAPARNLRAFGQAIGARSVVGRCHRHLHTTALQSFGDAGVIGGHPYLLRTGRKRTLRDMQHHGLTTNQTQRFAGQARCGVTRGDGDEKIWGGHLRIITGHRSDDDRRSSSAPQNAFGNCAEIGTAHADGRVNPAHFTASFSVIKMGKGLPNLRSSAV